MSDNNQELICLAEKLIVGARSDINLPGMLSLRIQRSGARSDINRLGTLSLRIQRSGARSDINRSGTLSLRIQRSGTYEAASQFLVPTLHTVLDDLYSEASYAMQNFHDRRNMSLMEKF